MKTITNISLSIAALTFLASCQKEVVEPMNPTNTLENRDLTVQPNADVVDPGVSTVLVSTHRTGKELERRDAELHPPPAPDNPFIREGAPDATGTGSNTYGNDTRIDQVRPNSLRQDAPQEELGNGSGEGHGGAGDNRKFTGSGATIRQDFTQDSQPAKPITSIPAQSVTVPE